MSHSSIHSGVSVAYIGVHQAYQLALAASEMGKLDAFYCSVYSEGWKWGGIARRLLRADLMNRRLEGLGRANIVENLWPLARKAFRDRIQPDLRNDWLEASDKFDRWAASKFQKKPSRVFIGTETCDLHTLRAARLLGATAVHDCPQVHPAMLTRLIAEASEAAGLPLPPHFDSPGMAERKLEEYALADWLLVYSDMHRRSFTDEGFAAEKIFQCPLWVETSFWQPAHRPVGLHSEPLKVMFAGSLTLRKGIPFLLKAFEKCAGSISLTLVGSMEEPVATLLRPYASQIRYVPPVSKTVLRKLYQEHDLFVLPSIVDSFGFVALEAMACGMAVVTTENCGAPVPNPEWHVPPMDPEALAAKLGSLAADRDRVAVMGQEGLKFASKFTSQRYRQMISGFLNKIL